MQQIPERDFIKVLQILRNFAPLLIRCDEKDVTLFKNTLHSKMRISIAARVHSSYLRREIVDAFIVAGSECNFSQYLRAVPAP